MNFKFAVWKSCSLLGPCNLILFSLGIKPFYSVWWSTCMCKNNNESSLCNTVDFRLLANEIDQSTHVIQIHVIFMRAQVNSCVRIRVLHFLYIQFTMIMQLHYITTCCLWCCQSCQQYPQQNQHFSVLYTYTIDN